MPTYRLDLAYDGSGFHGYARQPGLRTVQGVLEEALAPYIGDVPTYVAGRTDKGVHALEQVVSFTCGELDTERVVRSLNARLAPEIAVHGLTEVADGFHARFSATGRAYRYRVRNVDVHDPLCAGTEWTVPEPLDVEAMNAGVELLVGEHDFAAFCRRREGRPTVRDVFWAQWRRDGDHVDLSIGANSFCHQMVRSIVAMCVDVGKGRIEPAEVGAVLASGDRQRSRGVAPPHGLILVAVSYDPEPLPRPAWITTAP